MPSTKKTNIMGPNALEERDVVPACPVLQQRHGKFWDAQAAGDGVSVHSQALPAGKEQTSHVSCWKNMGCGKGNYLEGSEPKSLL